MFANRLRLIVGLLLGSLSTLSAEENPGSAWLVARGDAQGTGVAQTELPAKPELLWKFALPKGSFESTAAIANGLVFLGDMDAKFYALNLSTGEKVWDQPGKLGFPGSPAVRAGRVYIGEGATPLSIHLNFTKTCNNSIEISFLGSSFPSGGKRCKIFISSSLAFF